MRAFFAVLAVMLVTGTTFVAFVVMSVFGPHLRRWEEQPAPRAHIQAQAPAPPIEPAVAVVVPRPKPAETIQEKTERARRESDERRAAYFERRRLEICHGC